MAVESPTDPSHPRIEIDTRYAAERWPYVCPNGHIDWRATEQGFTCQVCEADGVEGGRFEALRDRRSGERIPRDRVLVTNTAVAAAYEVEQDR
jgi:hypothetical protein